jgi:purine nucleosidase
VVLQEHSLRPVIDRQAMHEYARLLDAEIKQRGAKTVFYLTWARQHIPEMQEGADPAKSPGYAKAMYGFSGAARTTNLETWCQQQKAGLVGGLNGAYLDIAKELGARVAPVGIAWKMALAADPPFVLHSPDKSHPNATGTYLAACVFYATLLEANPVGLPGKIKNGDKVLANIPDDQAKRLQEIAWAAVKAITFTTATIHAATPQPVSLIFDTDMMGDVDDVGTAAVLHALADQGEVKFLAMGVCVKNPWSPLGVVKGPAHNRASKYAQGIAEEFPHALKSAEDAPDAALAYRQVLAKQPDRSVVMVSVGQLTNFRNLLKTGPDEHSNVGGVELVKRKVRVWVCMGGKIPVGREANLINDGPAAAYAIERWPTPIVFSGWEIGQVIMTGAGLRKAPEGTPVRRAYELYNGLNDRQSWDQTAALYAVRGLDGGLSDYWDVVSEGHLHVNDDGSNEWRTSPDKDHAYLVRKMDPKKIAEVIEELMLRQP